MLYENINALCKQKGTTVCALEREVGIGNGVISKWRERSPRVDILKKVADHLGVTMDELLEKREE